jgi:LysR family hydrogen peroxide-inducible transcriptional activator
VAVAESLSFRKAAQLCHVSQPSLSAQLGQLEDALGIRLFERDRRGVLITTTGRAFVALARTILRDTDDLVETARRAIDPFSGTLTIGAIPTIAPYLLPSVAPALRKMYPDLTVRWIEKGTDSLVKDLDAGILDAVLLALEAEIGDVEHEVVSRDPFVLATAMNDPLGSEEAPVTAAELNGASVLLLDDVHCFRAQALAFCSGASARELEFRATSVSTLAQMVAGGVGATLLPLLAVATEVKRAGLRIRPIAEPTPGRTIALGWRKHSPIGPTMKGLASAIRDAYPTPANAGSTAARHARPVTDPIPVQ